jgi:hypothetical protein
MPKRYAREFRRAVCARLVAERNANSLFEELGFPKRPSISGSARGLARSKPRIPSSPSGESTSSLCLRVSPGRGGQDASVARYSSCRRSP